MARHRNNPNMAFWKMIKEGYDHFEVTHQEPKVDFCEKHYVFDAAKAPNATHDPVFQAAAKCPPYVIPDELASLVHDKQAQDDAEYAKLVEKGTPVAKLNTGIDGGMNKLFASHVPGASTGLSEGGEDQGLSLIANARLPGTIPGTVNPPHAPDANDPPAVTVAAAPAAPATTSAAAAPAATRVASASAPQSDGFFSSLAHKMGLGSATADTTATTPPPAPAPATTKPKADAKSKAKPGETKQAANPSAQKPSAPDNLSASDKSASSSKDAIVAGAQPIVSSNSFDSRFSATK
jgi:hypothetical protein